MTPPDGAPTRGVRTSITLSFQRAVAPLSAQRDHWLAAYGAIITAIVLTVAAFICYTIGLEAPPLSRAERPVVLESTSLTTAISSARDDLESPFAYLMAAAPQGLFGSAASTDNELAIAAGLPSELNTDLHTFSGNFYPRIAFAAAGALTVLVFLLIMRHLQVRYPVIWTLVFATNIIFIYYARTAGPVAPLVLVWALLLILIFILLTEIDSPRTWHVAGLAAVFTILPMVHWYGLIMLFAMDFPVLTMLWSRRHLPGRRWLLWLAVHAFLFVHFVAWGDVVINLGEAQFVPRTAASELDRVLNVEDIYLIFGRLVGGGGWWAWIWLVVLVGAALAWLAHVSRSRRNDKGPGEVTRLALAGRLCLVWVIGFVVLTSFLPGGMLVFLSVYPVLLLPLMIVFAWGATGLIGAGDWRRRTLAIGLVGAALVSNLVNSVPYVAAGAQFNDWMLIGDVVNTMTARGKTLVVINQRQHIDDIRLTLQHPDLEIDVVETPEQLQKWVDCCRSQLLYIHLGDPETLDIDIHARAEEHFGARQRIRAPGAIESLKARGVVPYHPDLDRPLEARAYFEPA